MSWFHLPTIPAWMRAPAPVDPFPWRGNLDACRAHVLARDAAKRSERTRKGNRTRRMGRVA